jgi:hypothetical protein
MNLFILSLCFAECAEAMFDKHISKMILEAVQMICTAKRILDPDDECDGALYKTAHLNHPTTKWIRESYENYMWTLDMVDAMHTEWKYRYEHPPTKIHKSYEIAQILRNRPPPKEAFPSVGLTAFAQAMPEQYKCEGDAVKAYREYYMSPEKRKFASWKRRNPPSWYTVKNSKSSKKIRILLDE